MKKENRTEWENFAYNVGFLRKRYDISKRRMAKIMEIGVKSLNKIESGELPPRVSIEIFFAIQKAFGIHPKEQLAKQINESDLKKIKRRG